MEVANLRVRQLNCGPINAPPNFNFVPIFDEIENINWYGFLNGTEIIFPLFELYQVSDTAWSQSPHLISVIINLFSFNGPR